MSYGSEGTYERREPAASYGGKLTPDMGLTQSRNYVIFWRMLPDISAECFLEL